MVNNHPRQESISVKVLSNPIHPHALSIPESLIKVKVFLSLSFRYTDLFTQNRLTYIGLCIIIETHQYLYHGVGL